MKPQTIQAGETFTFDFQVSGGELQGLSTNLVAKQFPGDVATVDRPLTLSEAGSFTGTLTSAETTAMYAAGNPSHPWVIHSQTTDADEDIRELIRIYITKPWV